MAKDRVGFDFRTQKMNKKGQVISRSPYRMHVEGGVKKLERPPGSGNFFYENGEPVKKVKEAKEEEKK